MEAMKRLRRLTQDESFFYKHAGYSYDPVKETPRQGRRRCAVGAARDERLAREVGLEVTWEHEQEDWMDFIGDMDETEARDKFKSGAWEVFYAYVKAEDGTTLASCGGIIIASDDRAYRRVMEAELLGEALHTLKKGASCRSS